MANMSHSAKTGRAWLFAILSLAGAAQAIIPAPQSVGSSPLPTVPGAYTISPDGEVTAADRAGLFYAECTRRQGGATAADFPRYSWRGLHLDVSRHFFPPQEVRRLLDIMSELKLNYLHMHLTDGPGWRLEIKRYPKLTEVGAWRLDLTHLPWDWPQNRIGRGHGKDYGGFYTQEEFRELVAYAADRHITIVPEVDFPGHSYATLVCYPELALPGFDPMTNGFRGRDCLDLQNPLTLSFAKHVLDELMNLLPPGTPIHLGGDEVETDCATHEQQRVWMQQLVDYTNERGYPAVTWDEAALCGVRGQTVMMWHTDVLPRLLDTGLPIILCPNSHFYFNFPQNNTPQETAGREDTPIITERDVFDYSAPDHPQILGLHATLWSEHIVTPQQLHHMAFPRVFALAERAWGSPRRPFDQYRRDAARLAEQLGIQDKE